MRLWLPPADRARLLDQLYVLMHTEQIYESACDALAEGPEVTLPGFNLLDQHGPHLVLSWFLKEPLDVEETWQAYEELATASQRRNRRPSLDAVRALGLQKVEHLFPQRRGASEWFEPTALVVGLIGHATESYVHVEPQRVRVDTGFALFEVAHNRVWSNWKGAYVPMRRKASDLHLPNLTIDPFTTASPLAHALVQVRAPKPALWMASVLLQSQGMGRRKAISLDDYFYREPRYTGRPRGVQPTTRTPEAAALAAMDALPYLDENALGVMEELRRILVPTAMTCREFDALGTSRAYSHERLPPRVVERFRNRLNDLAGL